MKKTTTSKLFDADGKLLTTSIATTTTTEEAGTVEMPPSIVRLDAPRSSLLDALWDALLAKYAAKAVRLVTVTKDDVQVALESISIDPATPATPTTISL